jgi:hypothetical protein
MSGARPRHFRTAAFGGHGAVVVRPERQRGPWLVVSPTPPVGEDIQGPAPTSRGARLRLICRAHRGRFRGWGRDAEELPSARLCPACANATMPPGRGANAPTSDSLRTRRSQGDATLPAPRLARWSLIFMRHGLATAHGD